jgi:hypothetical protein
MEKFQAVAHAAFEMGLVRDSKNVEKVELLLSTPDRGSSTRLGPMAWRRWLC